MKIEREECPYVHMKQRAINGSLKVPYNDGVVVPSDQEQEVLASKDLRQKRPIPTAPQSCPTRPI
jgi:hypothetical protein